MKKTLSTFIVSLFAITLFASVVPLEWDDPDNNPSRINEYRIYNTTGTEPATNRVRIAVVQSDGQTTNNIQRVLNIAAGTNVITVTAVATNGIESADSEPLTVVVPNRPGNIRINLSITPP